MITSDYNLKNTKEIISEKFVGAVNDFLHLSLDYQPLMQRLLYQHCMSCSEAASYGFEVLPGETETQANLRNFGVHDEASAFKNAYLDHVLVVEDSLRKNRFVTIIFYPEWEDEHGCELVIKNGVLLNYFGESGTYLGQFDD